MSTIERIRIEGFRSIREADVQLGPMTALIGANGAGKSSFALALTLLSYLETRSLGRFVADHGGAGSLLHRPTRLAPSAGLSLE